MSTEREEVPTRARWWLPVAAAFFVVGLAILPARDTASEQTPAAQPTWTPSPECRRLSALQRPRTYEEAVALKGCIHEAERHEPPQWSRPEWGPVRTPTIFKKRVFAMPTAVP